MPETFKGTIFLLSLVTSPQDARRELPVRRGRRRGPRLRIAGFDNLPLTALSLKQAATMGILALPWASADR